MQARRTARSTRSSARVAALALLAGLALPACNRSDQNLHAIATASSKLQSNSGGAYATPYDKFQTQNYRDTIAAAKPVLDAEQKSPEGSAAGTLVGAAQLGQAQALLDQAVLTEQIAINKMMIVRVLLTNWSAYSTSADSAGGFDPKAILAQIDAEKAEHEKEIQAFQSRLQDIERQLADLRAKAKARSDEATKLSEEFSRARESLGTLSARDAEVRLTEARETKRKGDGVRVEASRLQAQADVLQPEATELKVLIDATRNRIAGLDREKLELSEKAQQGRAAASQSQAAAAETAKQLEAALADLSSFRAQEVNPKRDAALSALRTAATTAKASSSDASAGGKILNGRVQLALAGALAAKASSLQMYVHLLQTAANASPALPFASGLAAQIKETSDQAQVASDEAKAAYEAAQSAFSSVQLRGPGSAQIKEKLTQLAESLGALAGHVPPTPAPAAAPTPAPAPAPVPPPTSQAPSPMGDDPKAAWEQIYAELEAGNKAALMPWVKLADPTHEATIATLMGVKVDTNDLDAACKEKFGKSMSEMALAAAGMPVPTAADFKIEVQGETATASHPSSPTPAKLVHENGKWMIDSSSIVSGQAAQVVPLAPQISAAAKSLAADIRAGKVSKAEDVLPELQKRVLGGAKPGGG